MVEKTQINIRVTESQKSKWKEYAEEHYGSLTKLIGQAVSKEIDSGSDDGQGGPSSEAVTDLQETVNSLENTVRDMDTRLSSVHESVQGSGPDISLRAAVRETLMTQRDGDNFKEYGLTPSQVAARLEGDTEAVRDALETLFEQERNVVLNKSDDGREFYFRRQRE